MKRLKIIGSLTILLICLIAAAFLYKKFGVSLATVPLEDTIPGKQIVKNETAYILLEDEYLEKEKALYIDGEYYISLNLVNTFDTKFYFEKNSEKLLFTNADSVIEFYENKKIGSDNVSFKFNVWLKKDDVIYLSYEAIKNYLDIDINLYKDPDRIVIFADKLNYKKTKISSASMRTLPARKAPIVKKLKDEEVYFLFEESGYSKVVSTDGYIGFVDNGDMPNVDKGRYLVDNNGYKYFSFGKHIILGFNQVTNEKANKVAITEVGLQNGVNIISPTWFSIENVDGSISDLSSFEYVLQMHSIGVAVWPLVDDFTNDVDMKLLLENPTARKNLIDNLITLVVNSGADGINIDFEKITKESSKAFIQFLRELYIESRKHNLVISVDNYSPREFNKFYDIKSQAEVIDYFIIMGYDEHTNGTDEEGSVASYEFVKTGIENTLHYVPKNKVINAMPFYTRLWNEDSTDSKGFNSIILSIKEQFEEIEKMGAEPTWDDVTKQNFAQFRYDEKLYKIWLEDSKSLNEKMNLAKENNLAGVAVWKLGLETSDVWKVIKFNENN